MNNPVFNPHRFRTTVPFYARYRVHYPAELISFVSNHLQLAAGASVLDLGTGPGFLAIAFARLGHKVTAIDPEPTMLEAARDAAEKAGVSVTFTQGSSFDLDRLGGRYQLVTMGRSFHWMDREATLASLDRMIPDGGAVALFSDGQIPYPGQAWRKAVLDPLATRYAPEEARQREARRSPARLPHEAVLLASPFRHLERHSVLFRQTLDIDAIIGRTFSMSVTSPKALGASKDAFEEDLRRELAALSPSGQFEEIVEVKALIARRG
ncbi:MAG: methyltransferase domain-containing protein [Chelatococcus sp.]|jgi:SAM-dependent methyltransferase|uniref:class I SAM-dependent methyltransferase n=1 Tax=unclassified Chelatococcus TaxID=2638111 RepID=UPI001BCB00D4|nr:MULTISPECIES: class I SAM-dependent methyltransferase [unclassified Chelatococcus]CAH1669786.1 Methyltransferase family protein [Hyphomicrobiales bacterium]MBS7738252.1 methyltransferase domain-containing protein [Chelatococcus sp. HY11]MBX3537802.1 methyltransferase domain-containing protein [Chelatococcus sp.]MBX3545780.1 methyltransferase domain-containing protein [Chelatococcus sp.]MCO5077402.1 class I SAM-dependent methyltransferase [Chelatococcus sp.]